MEIRTSDSKGRISGFRPSEHYHVERGAEGDVHVFPLVIEKRIPRGIGPKARRHLMKWGLDPERMYADGHTERGYFEFEVNEDGRRAYDGLGNVIKTWREWPEGFSYQRFVELAWREWAEDVVAVSASRE